MSEVLSSPPGPPSSSSARGERRAEVVRPLMIAAATALLTGVTLWQGLGSGWIEQALTPALLRYWSNPLCRLMLWLGWFLLLYGLLQRLGISRDLRRLDGTASGVGIGIDSILAYVSGRDPRGEGITTPKTASPRFLAERRHQVWSHLEPLRFGIWALPILGFIGTVLGISGSIQGLESLMAQQGGGAGAGFSAVTGDLYFAFDTTLVGLVLMLPLALLHSWLRGAEQRVDALIAGEDRPVA